MLTAPSMWPSSYSEARRTSRTATWRWWRTWARSANTARSKWPRAPSVHSCGEPRGGALEAVDADADELALRLGDLLGRVPEQRQRGAPGDEPAEVGRELAVEAEVQRPGHVPRRERGAAAQVDDPLAGGDPGCHRVLVGRLGCREVGRPGTGAVARPHVGVVRRVGVQPGEGVGDPPLLVLGEGGVLPLLRADRRLGRVTGGTGGAERAEPVRRQDVGVLGQLVGEAVRRRELVVHELVRVLGPRRSGRPVAPKSREPPVKTPTAS